MTLKEKIKTEIVTALKSGDKRTVSVLRYLVSLIDKKEISLPPGQMDDGQVLTVLAKELKDKNESVEMFKKGNRPDLVEETEAEIEILKKYLPENLSEEEIRQEVKKIMASKGVDFSVVMKEVMNQFRGRVEGQVVSRVVKEEITLINA